MKVLLRNFNVKIIIRNLIFLLSPHSGLFPDSSSSMAPEVTIIHTTKMKMYTINSQISLNHIELPLEFLWQKFFSCLHWPWLYYAFVTDLFQI